MCVLSVTLSNRIHAYSYEVFWHYTLLPFSTSSIHTCEVIKMISSGDTLAVKSLLKDCIYFEAETLLPSSLLLLLLSTPCAPVSHLVASAPPSHDH